MLGAACGGAWGHADDVAAWGRVAQVEFDDGTAWELRPYRSVGGAPCIAFDLPETDSSVCMEQGWAVETTVLAEAGHTIVAGITNPDAAFAVVPTLGGANTVEVTPYVDLGFGYFHLVVDGRLPMGGFGDGITVYDLHEVEIGHEERAPEDHDHS